MGDMEWTEWRLKKK